MLYVFHVDMGRMLIFDMNTAISSVEHLKELIERNHGLPALDVVLLVSGGEVLAPNTLVCSYSAGTDTNPIYMFCVGDKPAPWPSIEPDKDQQKDIQKKGYVCNVTKNILQEDWIESKNIDLREQVDHCLSLPATYSTVSERARLAAHLHELARDEENICAQLVLEQHLQQQGWAAVIANMEDLTEEFRQRSEIFYKSFESHFQKREGYTELLNKFTGDLEKLSQIPILPGLLENAEGGFQGFDEYLENDDLFSYSQQNMSMIRRSGETNQLALTSGAGEDANEATMSEDSEAESKLTLLQWLSAKKNHYRLLIMAQECLNGLSAFCEKALEDFKTEMQALLALAEKEEIKEIKGLGERLSGLEKLMYELKQKVKEQKDLSIAFQQNQNRASNLGDASVLPDLCASHRSQLLVMVGNQRVIRDIRRRISRAKDELSCNLEKRLKYIAHIENSMSERDNTLLFYHQSLQRIEKHMNIIQQIHQAPSIYVQAVSEVVRRRIFSGEFVKWASTLANDFFTIHHAEILRRQEFNVNFEGHFLNTLFTGMEDMPPAFTNESPIKFDANLPNLTKSDIETLSTYLPEITSTIHLPDMAAVIEFFASRSGMKISQDKMSSTNKLQGAIAGSIGAVHRPIDIHAHLKDGFESETDTEEFEKVGQSANERQHVHCATISMATSTSENNRETNTISTSTELREMNTASTLTDVPETNTVETLTEENLGSTRLEVENLKALLKSMSDVSYQCLNTLKKHIQTMKSDAEAGKSELQLEISKLTDNFNRIKNEYESREQETLQRLSTDYEKTISDIQENLRSKENELAILLREKTDLVASHTDAIKTLQKDKCTLKEDIEMLSQKIEALQLDLKKADAEKEKAVNECRDRLIHAHKTEIESLRCRFKLMTSMDRSPSDTSLEKIEKPDMIDIAYHESILSQTKEDMNTERQLAIKAAVEEERLKWIGQSSPTFTSGEFYKNIIEEKDKQLEVMRQRDNILSTENNQLKLRIQSLTNEEESDKVWLKEKLDHLNKDKTRLEQELNAEKSKRIEMETSFAILKGNTPEFGARSKMSSSQLAVKQGVCTESCAKGDVVFVVWSGRHRHFTVVQESTSLYFVHTESLPGLNLVLPDSNETEIPVPFFALGRVIDKEYCMAKKDTNRYRVTMGTKFYRVKLLPVPRAETTRTHHKRERIESVSSISSSVSRSTSTQHLIDTSAQTESPIVPSTSRDMVDSISFKERTTSFTNVAEEDDEPVSLLSERCRYISFSEAEEDDKAVTMEQTASDTDCAITANISPSTTTIASSTNSNQQDIPTESSSEKDQDDSDEYRSLEAKDEEPYCVRQEMSTLVFR